MNLSRAILMVLAPVTACAAATPLEECLGSAGLAHASGNGALTVGANLGGRVVSCCWPSPGAHDQITYVAEPGERRDAPPWHGLRWGVSFGGEYLWFGAPGDSLEQRYAAPGAPIIVTEGRMPGDGGQARQVLFVHAELDVLVARLEVTGPDSPPAFCFFANFTPCTRAVPELPLGDWAFDALNDFAAYADPGSGVVTHFRPAAPGMRDWEKARALAARGAAPSEWEVFRDGTSISYGAMPAARTILIGDETAFERTGTLRFNEDDKCRVSATGRLYSAMLIAPEREDGRWQATVLAAFGVKAAASRRLLEDAQARGYQRLLEETRQFWTARCARVRVPEGLTPEQQASFHAAVRTLLVSADRGGGAVVRAPVTQPPLALDWPRHGAWINLALDVAGYPETVERHLRFYAGTVRREPARGRPIGSLPAACYATGEEALPRAILDADAAAWFVASVWRHTLFLDATAQAAFLASLWDEVSLCADFLVRWSHGPLGEPLPAFEPASMRDRTSLESLLAFYLGIESAARIAGSVGQAVPAPWEQQRRELQSLIQLRLARLDTPEAWPETMSCWLDGVLSEDHWLRKPMRAGDRTWAPVDHDTITVPEPVTSVGPDALNAAFTLLRLLGAGPVLGLS